MNRKTWTLIASATLFSIFAIPVLAADKGFYLTATLGRAEEEPRSIGTNFGVGAPPAGILHITPDQIDVDAGGAAWSVGVGYRLNRYLAAEIEYVDFGTTDVSEHYNLSPPIFPFTTEFTREYSSKVTGPALSLLGSVPLGAKFELFLRAGVLFADRELELSPFPTSGDLGDTTFASTVWLGGAGVDWSVASRWAVRLEYQRTGALNASFLAGETELERLSLSALFRL